MADVLAEWRRLAFSDLRDLAEWDGEGLRVKPSAELEDDAARALDEIVEHKTRRITTRRTKAHGKPGEPGYIPEGEVETVTEERSTRVKLHDKVAALTALSKLLGILERAHDQSRERPLFPKDFFAAVVLGDVSKIRGFLPAGEVLDDEPLPDGE